MIQQLKAHIQQKTFTPQVDESYSAVAFNHETLRDILQSHFNIIQLQNAIPEIIIAGPLCALALISVLTVIVAWKHIELHKLSKKGRCEPKSNAGDSSSDHTSGNKAIALTVQTTCTSGNEASTDNETESSSTESENKPSESDIKDKKYHKKAIAYSIIAICPIILAYVISHDICAVYFAFDLREEELKYIYHKGTFGDGHDILFNIPIAVATLDLVFALLPYVIAFILICIRCCSKKVKLLVPTGITVFSGVFCISNHFFYIAMAYLDDPYHATSIFIFYIVIIIGLSFLNYFTIKLYFKLDKSLHCKLFWFIVLVLTQNILFLGLMVTVASYFYFLPIDKSISKAPNQLFSFHQSVVLLVGAFALYKGLIKRKKVQNIDRAIEMTQLHQLPQETADDKKSRQKTEQQIDGCPSLTAQENESNFLCHQ